MKKKKALALILVILLGPFGWLYDLQNNSFKAAIGIGSIVNAPLFLWMAYASMKYSESLQLHSPDEYSGVLYLFAIFVLACAVIITWGWAIIDTLKKRKWGTHSVSEKKKDYAIAIAICFGPWTWLYTFKKDWLRLIPGLIVTYLAFVADMLYSVSWVWLIIIGIWLYSIIGAFSRNMQWYQVS